MNIKTPTFAIVITFLTGLIATILGVWASLSPETFPGPSAIGAPVSAILSWSAREIAMAVASWIAILWLRDARVFMVVLSSAWVREILDFVDAFRAEDAPLRLFIVVGVSVVLHGIAVYMTGKAIKDHNAEHATTGAPAMAAGD